MTAREAPPEVREAEERAEREAAAERAVYEARQLEAFKVWLGRREREEEERDVAAVGDGVPADLLGRRVFAFAPHSSVAVVAADGIMPLPHGTEAADATFLPAVESRTT
mgnify:CR=1 FL=1